MRQMLAESLVIAAGGTALGVGLAQAGILVLVAMAPRNLPWFNGVDMDPLALTFAALARVDEDRVRHHHQMLRHRILAQDGPGGRPFVR